MMPSFILYEARSWTANVESLLLQIPCFKKVTTPPQFRPRLHRRRQISFAGSIILTWPRTSPKHWWCRTSWWQRRQSLCCHDTRSRSLLPCNRDCRLFLRRHQQRVCSSQQTLCCLRKSFNFPLAIEKPTITLQETPLHAWICKRDEYLFDIIELEGPGPHALTSCHSCSTAV